MTRLAWLLVTACTPAPGTPLETWNGVTAYVYNDKRVPVYARAANDASYQPPGVETSSSGFQCTELAIRYFAFEKGVPPYWDSRDAADMCAHHPTSVAIVDAPAVGDLIVFAANRELDDGQIGPEGHVAVIRGIEADGSLDLFQQRLGDETTAFSDGVRGSYGECFLRAP